MLAMRVHGSGWAANARKEFGNTVLSMVVNIFSWAIPHPDASKVNQGMDQFLLAVINLDNRPVR